MIKNIIPFPRLCTFGGEGGIGFVIAAFVQVFAQVFTVGMVGVGVALDDTAEIEVDYLIGHFAVELGDDVALGVGYAGIGAVKIGLKLAGGHVQRVIGSACAKL